MMDNFKKVLMCGLVIAGVSSNAYSMQDESMGECGQRGSKTSMLSYLRHPISSVKEAASYLSETRLAKVGFSFASTTFMKADQIGEKVAHRISGNFLVKSLTPCLVKNFTGYSYGLVHNFLGYEAKYFETLSRGRVIPISSPVEKPNHHKPAIKDHHENPCDGIPNKKPSSSHDQLLPKPNCEEQKKHTTHTKVNRDEDRFQLVGHAHKKSSRRVDCWGAAMPEDKKVRKLTKGQELAQIRNEIKHYGGLSAWAKVGNHNIYSLLRFDTQTGK